jgi:hypothetical protein
MNITYKNFVTDEIYQIIKFWNENSGWETTMDRSEFDLRFCSSPFGEPIMMLAIDDDVNEIVGLCCFLPVNVSVNGNDVKCYRPFGAVFKESFREKFGVTSLLTGQHPILKLYHKGAQEAKEKDAELIYLIPDPRWSKLSRVMPFEVRQLPLWSYKLTGNEATPINISTKVENINSSDPSIDELWNLSFKDDLCMITKNSAFYQWKINMRHGLYKLKGVYNASQLIGVYSLHFKPQEHQWIIGDILTLNNEEKLMITLQSACNAAQHELLQSKTDTGKDFKLSILSTSLLEEKLKVIGFDKENYNFTFAVHLLDKKRFSKSDVSTEKWLIGAND